MWGRLPGRGSVQGKAPPGLPTMFPGGQWKDWGAWTEKHEKEWKELGMVTREQAFEGFAGLWPLLLVRQGSFAGLGAGDWHDLTRVSEDHSGCCVGNWLGRTGWKPGDQSQWLEDSRERRWGPHQRWDSEPRWDDNKWPDGFLED